MTETRELRARWLVAPVALVLGLVAAACSHEAPAGDGPWRGDRRGVYFEAPSFGTEVRPADDTLSNLPYLRNRKSGAAARGVTYAVASAYAGLNLVVSGHAPEARLLDMSGQELHHWARRFDQIWPDGPGFDYDQPRATCWRHVEMLPDGGLVVLFDGIGLARLAADSSLVWAWAARAHDEFRVSDDGRVLALELTGGEGDAAADQLTTLAPDGTVTGRHALRQWLPQGAGAAPLRAESLALLEGPGGAGVVLGFPAHGAVAAVDLGGAGTVRWRLGASWQRLGAVAGNGAGGVLALERGTGQGSQVVELSAKGDVLWKYPSQPGAAFRCRYFGACQRLPNGNTLVTESDRGRAFEVTPDGVMAWEYVNPERAGADRELIAALMQVTRVDPAPYAKALPGVAEYLRAASGSVDTHALDNLLQGGKDK